MAVSETLYRKYKNMSKCEELDAYWNTLTAIFYIPELTEEQRYVIQRIMWNIKEEAYDEHCEVEYVIPKF